MTNKLLKPTSLFSFIIIILFLPGLLHSQSFNYVINSIEIRRGDVFNGEELSFAERATNKLHILTREKVIERELLFQIGDTLDFQLIQESERRLRKFDFLGVASISVDTLENNQVNISVRTEDQWTIYPAIILETGGDLIGAGISLEETNFLGWGKEWYLEVFNESDIGTTFSAQYFDPRLFGSKGRLDAGLSLGPINSTYYLSVYKPYFSSDSKWTYGVDLILNDEEVRLFNEGKEVSRIKLLNQIYSADIGYAFGERYRKKRVRFIYRYEKEEYDSLGEQTNSPLPENELVSIPTLEFSLEKQRFAKETRIDLFERIEDITIGRSTILGIGRAGFPIKVGEERWELYFRHLHAFQLNEDNYLFTRLSYQTQEVQNRVLSFDTKYYWQLARWQTLSFNVDLDYGWDLQESRQFLLGAESGLRGYNARAFNGDKRFLMNLESRLFSPFKVLTVAVGSVVFIDAGNAWKRDEVLDLSTLNYSAGIGLRLGLTKLPGAQVIRVDVGWPLNNSGGAVLSIGLGQQFSIPRFRNSF